MYANATDPNNFDNKELFGSHFKGLVWVEFEPVAFQYIEVGLFRPKVWRGAPQNEGMNKFGEWPTYYICQLQGGHSSPSDLGTNPSFHYAHH